jgi:hypothetical protein
VRHFTALKNRNFIDLLNFILSGNGDFEGTEAAILGLQVVRKSTLPAKEAPFRLNNGSLLGVMIL